MTKLAKKTHTTEEIKNEWKHYCTVGQLREFLEKNKDIPDDAKIFIERVPDYYFDEGGWGSIKIKGDIYRMMKDLIDKSKPGGEYHDREKYPDMTDKFINNMLESEKDLDDYLDEYVPGWWVFKYEDDKNGIFITAHY